MVHDDADRSAVRTRHRHTPLGFRDSFRKGGQAGCSFLDAIRQ
jgi:hypothetical protein